MSKSTVEPIAISQQPATKASWSSNFYIYYKQFRNKVLSIYILNNEQNRLKRYLKLELQT